MAIKSSTGALTHQEKQKQNERYAQNHSYDYLFVGTGHSALVAAALFAKAGKKICMLEAHDTAGGYAHSFEQGGFKFCAQVHYIWGCGEGDTFHTFLKKIGLDKKVTFELYDADGYDHIVLPDGKTIKTPYGFDRFLANLIEAFPTEKQELTKFISIMSRISDEMKKVPDGPYKKLKLYATIPRILTLVKYRNATLQDVFDVCKLSKEAQAALSGNAGDLAAPPDELSIIAYSALMAGYNAGAYYPTKHYHYYIDSLVEYITSHDGCHIYYEMPVKKIHTKNEEVTGVETEDGKTFKAQTYVCNADPQHAAKELIGWELFSKKEQKKLSYEYSPSGMMMYLGLKDIDLKSHGFGKHNIWHLQSWDMNENWHKKDLEDRFSDTWFFASTPTLHSKFPGTTPKGNYEIMEVATCLNYEDFKEAQDASYATYAKLKRMYSEKLIDLVEKYYIPDIRKHIVVKTVGSPTTFADYVRSPHGNVYGAHLSPFNLVTSKVNKDTPFHNLYWCNATSGAAGMHGTMMTGSKLYMDLTGDRFQKFATGDTYRRIVQRAIKSGVDNK